MLSQVRDLVLTLPEIRDWPDSAKIVRQLPQASRPGSLAFPASAAEAVGGSPDHALPASAAIYCAQMSIHLVDDMLDNEAHGLFRELGEAQVANLSLAFQAAAFRIAEGTSLSSSVRCAFLRSLADVSIATAYGQAHEARLTDDEDGYWMGARAKTPPLFRAALFTGALTGGAQPEDARQLEPLGDLLGLMIQIQDDLGDAMHTPAKPDWRLGHNLPILYARTADYPQREQFLELIGRIEESEVLDQAQQILFRCGAVSYCCHRVLAFYDEARTLIEGLALPRPAALARLLDTHVEPVLALLRQAGVTDPESLLTTSSGPPT